MSGEPAVEVVGLRKTYRRAGRSRGTALDGLDLLVPTGGVHGFLGPNGAGKTTTIRALLGLVRADSGRIRLFGSEVPRHLPAVMGRVGALVETPRFSPALSGRMNLDLLARTAGLPSDRVARTLDLVGLTDRADDPFAGYSLGMMQRLGIAAALLKHPRLLILDEPSNGLDPEGIRDVRDLVRRLAAQGTTVLLSSHLLAEVQAVCDRVSVVARGRCVATGTVAELVGGAAGAGGAPGGGEMLLRADRHEEAREVLVAAGWRVEAAGPGGPHRPGAPDPWRVHGVGDPAGLTAALADRRIYVTELVPVQRDLEAVYFGLVTGPAPVPAGAA